MIDFYDMVAGKRLYLSELCYLNLISIARWFKYYEGHLQQTGAASVRGKMLSVPEAECKYEERFIFVWELLLSNREGENQNVGRYLCLRLCHLELSVTPGIIHCSDGKCIKSQCASQQNPWDEKNDKYKQKSLQWARNSPQWTVSHTQGRWSKASLLFPISKITLSILFRQKWLISSTLCRSYFTAKFSSSFYRKPLLTQKEGFDGGRAHLMSFHGKEGLQIHRRTVTLMWSGRMSVHGDMRVHCRAEKLGLFSGTTMSL